MTFEEYWKRMQAKNEGLLGMDTGMTLSVASFKRSLEQAFNAGMERSRQLEKNIEHINRMFGL